MQSLVRDAGVQLRNLDEGSWTGIGTGGSPRPQDVIDLTARTRIAAEIKEGDSRRRVFKNKAEHEGVNWKSLLSRPRSGCKGARVVEVLRIGSVFGFFKMFLHERL